jgi:hypothetical protein
MHPYKNLPDYCFWNKSVVNIPFSNVDPIINPKFQISMQNKIATAGSCFAQHLARHLSANGFNYFCTELGHEVISQDLKNQFNYGIFSARYGNLYTTKQLLQLIQRAYGTFKPIETIWNESKNNSFIDPLRPLIQPNGFFSYDELIHDREIHLKNVRLLFENLDYFIFTLGLTEAWVSKEDGTVFPICPGVAGGNFDADKYVFINYKVDEIVDDFLNFQEILKSVNPNAKIILTVSPVPLIATAENKHVLVSTTLSKSILRVAAENISNNSTTVDYFPSYEIITGNFNRGNYFGPDLRSITEEGVAHVMRLFLKHYAGLEASEPSASEIAPNQFYPTMKGLVEVNCDEAAYDSNK